MGDKTNSLYGMICEIVRKETIYLRHYIGQVISQLDDLNIGMVQVTVPELGWSTAEDAPWCYPRQTHSMIVPEKGEWVEVYFMNGDMNKPVYLAICNELKRDDNTYTVPEWYTGDPKVRVLYQSPVTKKGIKLDESSGDMLLDSDTVTLVVESTEPFVLGNNLKTWAEGVDDAISALSTWAQTGTGAGGSIPKFLNTPPIETTFPANALSTKIKGQ